MILRSTPESIQDQQVSILALVETIAATAVVVLIYYFSGSFLHVAIGAGLAPFLLLQTPTSSRRAIKFVAVASRIIPKIMVAPLPDPSRFDILRRKLWVAIPVVILLEPYLMVSSLSLYFIFIVSCIVAKAVLAIAGLLSTPLTTLNHLPENWRRAVLYTDSATIPEFVPGLDKHPGANDFLPLSLREILTGPGNRVAGILFFTIFLYLPAVSYRWSLKATALIWSPLLWAFRPIARGDEPSHFAQGIIRLTRYRLARLYSAIIALAFLLKIAALLAWTQLLLFMYKTPQWEVIARFVSPETIPLWHIAAFVNATLTWIIFLRSEQYLHELSGPNPISPQQMRTFFMATFVARNVLTIYVVSCTLYLVFELAGVLDFPRVRLLLFPWS